MRKNIEPCKECNKPSRYVTLCDKCNKDVSFSSIIELTQTCTCWGNDSIEGYERFDFCCVECMTEFLLKDATFNDKDYKRNDFLYQIDGIGIEDFRRLLL